MFLITIHSNTGINFINKKATRKSKTEKRPAKIDFSFVLM